MGLFGMLFIVLGPIALIFGVLQHFKGKRILAAPYKKTGDIAKNPVSEDPKGAMSTEGKIVPPAQQLLSPMSKQPCLYYEVKVERMYEKTETTQDGTKTVKGTDTLDTVKGGAIFGLDDGSGVVMVDVTKGADFDNLKDGQKKELNGGSTSSHLRFGEMDYDVPVLANREGWTTGFKATEKYVPVEGNSVFALGKLEAGKIIKPSWRSLLISSKGREGLLGSVNKKKKFSLIGGGVATVAAIPLLIFAPAAPPSTGPSASCERTLADARVKCSANVDSKDGDTYTWTVTKPGKYELEVFAPAKKISLDPQLIIKSSTGEELANVSGATGGTAQAEVEVKAGTYNLTVRPADDYMVKGGFDYEFEIRSLDAPAAPAVADKGGEAAPAANGEVIKIDAPKLATEFMVKKGSQYEGHTVEAKGVIEAVDTDVDMTLVHFASPTAADGCCTVSAALPAKANVKKGQVVTIKGEVTHDGESVILLTNAELVAGAPVAAAPAAAKAPAKAAKPAAKPAKAPKKASKKLEP